MKITLLDTGYLTRDRSGTQETAANRAGYDGSSAVTAFTLNVRSIKESSSANVSTDPVPGSTHYAELDKNSYENPKYTLKLIIAKNDATAGFQYSQLWQLRRVLRTKGVKILYPSDELDTNKSLVEENGVYNASNSPFQGSGKELAASTPHLIGRITNLDISDSAQPGYWDISITFIEE